MQRLSTILVLSLLTAGMMWPSEAAIDGEGLHLAALWHVAALVALLSPLGKTVAWSSILRPALGGIVLLSGGFWLSTWYVFAQEGDRRAALNLSLHWSAVVAAIVAFLATLSEAATRRTAVVMLMGLATGAAALGIVQHHAVYAEQADWYRNLRQRLTDLSAAEDFQSGVERREIEAEFAAMNIPLEGSGRELFERRLLASSEPIGPFALANTLAGILAAAVVLLAGGVLQEFGKSDRRATLVLRVLPFVLLLGYCLVLTKSRTAWIATAVGIVGLVFGGRIAARTAKRLLAGTGAVAILLLFVGIGTGAIDREVVLESPRSLQFRLFYWMGSAGVIAENPLFGAGPGNFRQAYLAHKPLESSEEILDPHNIVIDAWCSAGLLGLAGVLVLLAGMIRACLPDRGLEGESPPVAVLSKTHRRDVIAAAVVGAFLHLSWRWFNGGDFLALDLSALSDSPDIALLVPLGGVLAAFLLPDSLAVGSRTAAVAAATVLLHLMGAGGLQIVLFGWLLAFLAVVAVSPRLDQSQVSKSSARFLLGPVLVTMTIATFYYGVVPRHHSEAAIRRFDALKNRGVSSASAAFDAIDEGIAADPFRVILRQRKSEFASYRLMEELSAHAPFGNGRSGADDGELELSETDLRQLEMLREMAETAATEQIAADRRNWHGYLERGRVHEIAADASVSSVGSDVDRWGLALADVRSALNLYPTNVLLWVTRARLDRQVGDDKSARQAAEEALRIEKSNREWGHIDRFLTEEQLQEVNDYLKLPSTDSDG